MPGAGTSPVETGGSGTGGSAGTATTGGGDVGGSGGGGGLPPDPYSGPFKILVLSTALEFPHDSIIDCQYMMGVESAAAQLMGKNRWPRATPLGQTPDGMMPAGTKPGSQWTAELAGDDLAQITAENLKNYAMVFSCNPTGTVFSGNPKVQGAAEKMAALQSFVEGGGAWAGVHSATDFEKKNGFPWFTNTLTGAYFVDHDFDGTPGTVQIQSMFMDHPVLKGLSPTLSTQDEWYKMNRDVSAQPGFQILQRLQSDQRALTWIKELGTNGRMFYTVRGHNPTVYEEPEFRKLVLNGVLWATHRLN